MENQVLHALQRKPNASELNRKQNLNQSASGTTYEELNATCMKKRGSRAKQVSKNGLKTLKKHWK